MNNLLLIAWLVSSPTLTMTWTHSDPPAVGYHIIAEYDGGETECIAVTMDNRIEWRLKWKAPTRMYVVPVSKRDVVHREMRSLPSSWYVWGKLKLYIRSSLLEVSLQWSDVNETVTVYSSPDLTTWQLEDVVPPPANQWWDNIMNMDKKFYKLEY